MGPVDRLAELVRQARSVVAITGAGISTESGLPDFRSEDGLWADVDPLAECSLSSLERDPARFWAFYRERLHFPGEIEPNAAHRALVDLEQHGLQAIITQNVDGLHQRAGSTQVIEVHGTGRTVSCLACGHRESFEAAQTLCDEQGVPRCRCGQALKPDVVLFEEQLPPVVHTAMALCWDADLVLCIGTSLTVYPVASWPALCVRNGGKMAILTRSPTDHDGHAAVKVTAPLGQALPELISCLER